MTEQDKGIYEGPERRGKSVEQNGVAGQGQTPERRARPERRAAQERRSGMDRRSGIDRRAGLDVGRGPGRRLSDVRKSAEEGSYSGELREFILAIDEYKRRNQCPFPSYSQIFEIVKFLGYRKVASEAEHINEVVSEETPAPVPVDAGTA